MNYTKIYNELIRSALLKSRNREDAVIYEEHHILPKCMGGDNSASNKVLLTLDEHFLSHKLLYRIHLYGAATIRTKLLAALNRMVHSKKGYRVTRKYYAYVRGQWILNHPCKNVIIQEKIRNSLHQYRLNNGWVDIFCACGCNAWLNSSKKHSIKKYIKGHETKIECACGCGELLKIGINKYLPDHNQRRVKCACGCGNYTHKIINVYNPKSCFLSGHDESKNKRVSNTLHNTLISLNSNEMMARMKNSTMKANHSDRVDAIKRGKASTLEVVNIDGSSEEIYSDQVDTILGLDWQRVKYRISAHNGLLLDGRIVKLINKYTGGNKWKNK